MSKRSKNKRSFKDASTYSNHNTFYNTFRSYHCSAKILSLDISCPITPNPSESQDVNLEIQALASMEEAAFIKVCDGIFNGMRPKGTEVDKITLDAFTCIVEFIQKEMESNGI